MTATFYNDHVTGRYMSWPELSADSPSAGCASETRRVHYPWLNESRPTIDWNLQPRGSEVTVSTLVPNPASPNSTQEHLTRPEIFLKVVLGDGGLRGVQELED